MKEKLKRFFTEYSREKIIALFVTFIIWTFAVNRNQETRSFNVKVDVKTSKEHVLVSDTVDSVHVKVSGSVFDFAGIEPEDLVLKIDLSNRKPGKFTRFLDSGMLKMGGNLRVVKIFPSELIFKTEKKAEKIVDVEPWLEGQPPLGWKLKGYETVPQKVKISGPEETVEEIDSVSTQRIELGKLKNSVNKDVQISLPSPYMTVVGDNNVKVKIDLERDIKIRTFAKVPIVVEGGKKAEIEPSHVKVRLKGPKDELEKLDSSGFSVYVKDAVGRKNYTVDSYFLKDLSPEIELLDVRKLSIKVRKESK